MQFHSSRRRLTRAPYRRPRRSRAADPMTDLLVDEAVTRSMVEGVVGEVRDLQSRLTGFFYTVLGSIVADILLRLWRG